MATNWTKRIIGITQWQFGGWFASGWFSAGWFTGRRGGYTLSWNKVPTTRSQWEYVVSTPPSLPPPPEEPLPPPPPPPPPPTGNYILLNTGDIVLLNSGDRLIQTS